MVTVLAWMKQKNAEGNADNRIIIRWLSFCVLYIGDVSARLKSGTEFVLIIFPNGRILISSES